MWMNRHRHIQRPSLGAGSLTRGSNRPNPCTYTSTHTYSSSPFTTSTQWDRVTEVAEADLGQNREHAKGWLVGVQTAIIHSCTLLETWRLLAS